MFVTHDQEEALSISDRVAVMNDGHVLQMAAPALIYHAPATAFVAKFSGAGGVLKGVAVGAGVKVGDVFLLPQAASGMAPGTDVELFLRPEHVILHAGGTSHKGLPAQVRELTFFGALTRIKLALSNTPDGEIWADVPSESAERFAPGTSVSASWAPESSRVMRV